MLVCANAFSLARNHSAQNQPAEILERIYNP